MKSQEFFWKVKKTIPLLVTASEKYLSDGKIEPKERHPLVMSWIRCLAGTWQIKINPFIYWIISILVSWAAKKLPSRSITIPPYYKEIM